MELVIQPGTYVVAVSGGVDSVTLLHLLTQQPETRFIVAHFDHGIRDDSAEDRRHVQTLARQYGLPFVYNEGRLGAGASEAVARKARYDFLRRVRQASGARGIITAHHQDDALETALLNLSRGTGRKGLSSLGNSHDVLRPLLSTPKIDIINHANEHNLQWREDSTNHDQAYRRNYIRHTVLSRLDPAGRQRLWELIERQREINHELDSLLVNQLHLQPASGQLDRRWFAKLPHDVSKEILATWLRAMNVRDFDKKMLERLTVKAKTARPGQAFDIVRGHALRIGQDNLALTGNER